MFPPVPANCVVTGGSGFVGQRLVEMLVERGAQRVVSFDVAPKPRDALTDSRVVYQQGTLTKLEDVLAACQAKPRLPLWRAASDAGAGRRLCVAYCSAGGPIPREAGVLRRELHVSGELGSSCAQLTRGTGAR